MVQWKPHNCEHQFNNSKFQAYKKAELNVLGKKFHKHRTVLFNFFNEIELELNHLL